MEKGIKEQCFQDRLERQQKVRDRWCVDPCAADACLKVWDCLLETCSEGEATLEQCTARPQAIDWYGNNPDHPCSDHHRIDRVHSHDCRGVTRSGAVRQRAAGPRAWCGGEGGVV